MKREKHAAGKRLFKQAGRRIAAYACTRLFLVWDGEKEMEGLLDLRFHVGVLGAASAPKEAETLESIRTLFGEIRNSLSGYNNAAYGLSGKDIAIDLYADTRLCGAIWADAMDEKSMTLNFIDAAGKPEKADTPVPAASVTSLNGTCGRFDETVTALEWIVAQSDLILLLQDGDEKPDSNGVWSALSGRLDGVFCVGIDAETPGNVRHMAGYFYEPFSAAQLSEYIGTLFSEAPQQAEQTKETPFFLSRLWHGCYRHFIKKYKAQVVYEDNSVKSAPEQSPYLEERFKAYDDEANKIAGEYREAIYFRSILPFLSCVFLAVGFYTETLLGIVGKFQITTNGGTLNVWMIVAGIGFLINGLIGAYTYLMSRSKAVNRRQSDFLNARYVAEFLRIAKEFDPAGVPVSPRFVRDRRLMAGIRSILRAREPHSYAVGRKNAEEIVSRSVALIDGQIQYHERTKARLKKIVDRLGAFREGVFWAGFGFVLLRGALQFAMPFLATKIGGSHNDIAWVGFIRSFSNMLALVIPAWAVYFSSKLSLNNFSGLYDHSERTLRELRLLRHKAESLAKNQPISYEALMALPKDLLAAQMSEVDDWYAQTAARTVQRL